MIYSNTGSFSENNSKTLSDKLRFLLAEVNETKAPLPIKEMVEVTGSQGFGILLLFLSMPSALPVPAPGYSIPFGLAIFVLLAQMFMGKRTPWLPKKVENLKISPAIAKKMLSFSIKVMSVIERFIHPRIGYVSSNRIVYVLMLILTVIMIIPIPLTNTAPAGIIFLFAISLIEKDGLFGLLPIFIGSVLLTIYLAAAYIFIIYGMEGLYAVKDWLF